MCSLKKRVANFLKSSFLDAEQDLYKRIRLRQRVERKLRKKERRRFLILLDYENVFISPLGKGRDKLRDLSWIIEPVLAEGEITFAMAFVPDNIIGTVPMELYYSGFLVISTPPKTEGEELAWKYTDSADQIMTRTGKSLIQHSHITDVVIVSGDADFNDLVNFARFKGCHVKVVAYESSLSKRFQRPGIEIEYIRKEA